MLLAARDKGASLLAYRPLVSRLKGAILVETVAAIAPRRAPRSRHGYTAGPSFQPRGALCMSGNTYGKLFTVTTAGESHGPALVAIVDGCPPGIELSLADLWKKTAGPMPKASR